MHTKTLWIKDEYLRYILDGSKTIEIRVAYSNINRLQPGDCLLLNNQHPYIIKRIERYSNFQDLLAHENPATIAPDILAERLLEVLQAIYPADKEALGVVALHLQPGTT